MANEDFTTYTATNPGYYTITAPKVIGTDIENGDRMMVYKDFSAAYFNGDLIHQFECNLFDWANGSVAVSFFMLSEELGGRQWQINNSGNCVNLLEHSANNFYFELTHAGTNQVEYMADIVQDTTYFVTIIRNDSGGANSTGLYICYVRTGSHEGTLIDTSVLDSVAGGQDDFRYLSLCAGNDDGGEADGDDDMFVQNLNLNEVAVSPYEDFTTYTEVDPNDKYTVVPNRIHAIKVARNEAAYLYKDKGVGHFNEDFTHQFETTLLEYNTSGIYAYALMNSIQDVNSADINLEDLVYIMMYGIATPRIDLRLIQAGVLAIDSSSGLVYGTRYYITFVRDDDAGVSSKGLYTVYIRTGSHEGSLIDTITVSSTAQYDWRYVYGINTYLSGAADWVTGDMENIDLNEAVATLIAEVNTVLWATLGKLNAVAVATIGKIIGQDQS